MGFAQELWRAIGPIYAAILRHPFVRGLTDGSLPRESFRFYAVQDALYLREFARALSLAAARAPEEDRKSTRLNSSHDQTSYADFCLKKKNLLKLNDPPAAHVAPGAGPRHFSVHPSGRYGYVMNEMNCTITAFTRDMNTGALQELQTV